MRKIDKSIILSTAYKKWVDDLEAVGSVHKKYDGNASKFRFYIDVVMNLFHCQEGLCAYTEQQLCPDAFYQEDKWNTNGKYIKELEKVFQGELDHFDESLKNSQGWLWENFFMIDSDTNNLKGSKPIDYILKPDRKGYAPHKLLDYSLTTGLYIPNPKLLPNRQKRVSKMLEILGINHQNIVNKRKREVERLVMFPKLLPKEFPTAIKMATH